MLNHSLKSKGPSIEEIIENNSKTRKKKDIIREQKRIDEEIIKFSKEFF